MLGASSSIVATVYWVNCYDRRCQRDSPAIHPNRMVLLSCLLAPTVSYEQQHLSRIPLQKTVTIVKTVGQEGSSIKPFLDSLDRESCDGPDDDDDGIQAHSERE